MTLEKVLNKHGVKNVLVHFIYQGQNLVYFLDSLLILHLTEKAFLVPVRVQKKGDFLHVYLRKEVSEL